MVHVAVLTKPYADLILSGRKTAECRLTKQARDPYGRVEVGERIYFKRSAGRYTATAIAKRVLFERDLTPRRIGAIRRDYNHLICGDDAFWRDRCEARCCSLIWLHEVQATSIGPRIRPLQGVAWLCLDRDPAWRRADPAALAHAGAHAASFAITITAGNIRNNTVYVTGAVDRFPESAVGGARRVNAGRSITLVLHEGPTVQTDIVGARNLLRTRVWGSWFNQHGAQPGDRVVFTPMGHSTFTVGLVRDERRTHERPAYLTRNASKPRR